MTGIANLSICLLGYGASFRGQGVGNVRHDRNHEQFMVSQRVITNVLSWCTEEFNDPRSVTVHTPPLRRSWEAEATWSEREWGLRMGANRIRRLACLADSPPS